MFQIFYSETAQEDLTNLPLKHAAQIGRLQSGLHGDIKRLQNHDIAGFAWEIFVSCSTWTKM